MKTISARLVFAIVLLAATYGPGYGEDAVAPAPATPAASAPASATDTPSDSTQPSPVPRPALVPQAAKTTSAQSADVAPRPYKRRAHRRYQHFASWEPFPLYLPRFVHQRVYWSRVRWFGF